MAHGRVRTSVEVISKTKKQKAERILRELERKVRSLAETFYEIGDLLVQVHDGGLYRALGYVSFVAFIEATGILAPTQAKKLMEVRRKFGRQSALSLGPEKAYAIARYTAHTKVADTPEELLEAGFPVAGRRVSMEEVSVRAIQRATRTVLARQGGSVAERERRDAERARRRAEETLRHRGIEGAEVQVRRRRGRYAIVLVIAAGRIGDALGLSGAP